MNGLGPSGPGLSVSFAHSQPAITRYQPGASGRIGNVGPSTSNVRSAPVEAGVCSSSVGAVGSQPCGSRSVGREGIGSMLRNGTQPATQSQVYRPSASTVTCAVGGVGDGLGVGRAGVGLGLGAGAQPA